MFVSQTWKNSKGVINTIVGGFARVGAIVSAHKRHLQIVQSINMVSTLKAPKMPPITFTSVDFKAIDSVQDDSIIISVEITNCIVQKHLSYSGTLSSS